MSSVLDTFFTSVGCMDGRVQEPVAKFGRSKFNALYPDTITEAGLVGLLTKDNPDQSLIDSLKAKIDISIQKHGSRGIVVHGHEDCAGNPVDYEKHKEDVRKSVEVIKKLINNRAPVYGVFVKRQNGDWIVEELK